MNLGAFDEMAVSDGWEEVPRVFLADEVVGDVPEEEERDVLPGDQISDDNTSSKSVRKRKRRFCVGPCDCERTLGGRKCLCEMRLSGFCSEMCGCDKSRCRAYQTSSNSG